MKNGCVYRCLDPNCNDATFDITATSCAHCGNTKLQAEHPSGSFDKDRQAFICSHCGEEDFDNGGLSRLRKMARNGELDKLAPGFSSLFDLTDH
jgi:hypothetical protein